jgi:ferredoxin
VFSIILIAYTSYVFDSSLALARVVGIERQMTRILRVTVDKNVCVSNLWCVKNLPAVFREDSDGQGEAFDVSGADEAAIIEAGYACPSGAISVMDASTGENLVS